MDGGSGTTRQRFPLGKLLQGELTSSAATTVEGDNGDKKKGNC